MKRIIEKINKNKILFSITIITIFILFMLITCGFNGAFVSWPGLLKYIKLIFDNLYMYTYYGKDALEELFWILLFIPILLFFKNKYIFTQKKESFFKSLLKCWPILTIIVLNLIQSIKSVNAPINPMEIISLALLTFAIGVFEELACRGWLLNEFIERFGNTRKNVIFSILVSAFTFGILHIINLFGGQPLMGTIQQIIGATFMGVALGAIYYTTKNIWTVVFIHGFWDFSVMFADINAGSSCVTSTVENVSVIIILLFSFISLFNQLPIIGNALLLLGKDKINVTLPKEKQEKLSDEKKKSCHIFRIVISILLIIYLVIFGFMTIFSSREKANTCPTYINKEVKEYSEKIINNTNYTIDIEKKVNNTDCLPVDATDNMNNHENQECISEVIEKYQFNLKINDDNKVVISNCQNNVTLDYKDVISLVVYENTDYYTILVSAYNDDGYVVVYHSNYLTKQNISNDISYLNDLKKSFKQVLLPNIYQIGYYEEAENNYKYPLFITRLEDRYILDQDGKIYKYNVDSDIIKKIFN